MIYPENKKPNETIPKHSFKSIRINQNVHIFTFTLLLFNTLWAIHAIISWWSFICSTMWVGRQSRRFLCLFWRETRQRIHGHENSPYLEVGRGREWELATGPGGEQLALDKQRGEQRELAWNHGQGQSTPDSGDSSREDRVQRQWVKMSLIPVGLWNFR